MASAMILLFLLLFSTNVLAAGEKLKAPKITKAESTAYNKIQLEWEPVPGAACYSVFYKGGNITGWTIVKKGIRGTSYTHISSASDY